MEKIEKLEKLRELLPELDRIEMSLEPFHSQNMPGDEIMELLKEHKRIVEIIYYLL